MHVYIQVWEALLQPSSCPSLWAVVKKQAEDHVQSVKGRCLCTLPWAWVSLWTWQRETLFRESDGAPNMSGTQRRFFEHVASHVV